MPTALLEKLEHEALQLDRDERIILGQELLASTMTQEEAEIEKEWLELSKRRLQEFDEGKVQAIPGEQVMAEAFAKFRK